MILLYSVLVFCLRVIQWLIGRQVASLERRFEHVAREADALVRETSLRPGNCNKPDPAVAAKQQFVLGQVVQKRDALEARHEAWLRIAERYGKIATAVRQWKGRKVPYAFGAVDFYMVMSLVDHLGVGDYLRPQGLTDWVGSFFQQ